MEISIEGRSKFEVTAFHRKHQVNLTGGKRAIKIQVKVLKANEGTPLAAATKRCS